jgi:hypothetical protein
MLLEINQSEVFLDFHIYAILGFDLLIGLPLKKLLKEKSSHGGLDEKLGIAASTPIPKLKSPRVKHIPNHDPFEEEKFIFPFVSPRPTSETKCRLPPSLELEPCPSSYPNIVLNGGRDSMLILQDISLKEQNFHAMDMPKATTLETKQESTNEHVHFSFETSHVPCSFLRSLEFVSLLTTCPYEDPNHLLILVSKLFKGMVVDAYVYHKHCKYHSGTMKLALQLEQ